MIVEVLHPRQELRAVVRKVRRRARPRGRPLHCRLRRRLAAGDADRSARQMLGMQEVDAGPVVPGAVEVGMAVREAWDIGCWLPSGRTGPYDRIGRSGGKNATEEQPRGDEAGMEHGERTTRAHGDRLAGADGVSAPNW